MEAKLTDKIRIINRLIFKIFLIVIIIKNIVKKNKKRADLSPDNKMVIPDKRTTKTYVKICE